MGSYDIIIKTEEIRRRVQEGEYSSAQKIMDTMVLKKVKNIADLSFFADVYIQNEEYDKAMELLNRIYKKSKTRRTLYQMVQASIGRKNIEDAEIFLKEYTAVDPNDFSIYIFRYKIDKAKKEPYNVLIDSLKKLKEYTYIEKWAYELAKLYYKAGMEKECIQECSDLILWFGEGSYVEKAKILKAYYSGEVDKEEIIENLKNRAIGGMFADTDERSNDSEKENSLAVDADSATDEGSSYTIEEASATDEGSSYTIEEASATDEESSYTIEEASATDEESKVTVEEATAIDESSVEEDTLVTIELHNKPEDIVLDELAESVGKEVDGFMTDDEEEITAGSKFINYKMTNIMDFIRNEEKNEDLDRLDRLAEINDINVYQIFGGFLHIKSIQKQLVKSLELIMNKHTKSVQMIITGAPSSGKTTLAKDIAIFLNRTGKLKTSKIAKISSIKLNEIDITNMKDELRNSCLVIENASELKKPTIDKLLELIKYFHGEIAVIFEENKKNMNRLFRECPKLMELFKNRIHLPSYTEEDLMGFAYSYIILREYKIHPLALDVLKEGVAEIIENTAKDKRLESISKYIQMAMTSADLRTGRLLPELAAEGRLAEADILSLLPEDFN